MEVIMQLIRAIRVNIKNFMVSVMKYLIRGNSRFYGRYFGSDNFFVLLIKNVVRPKRFFIKLIYGQVIPLPSFILLSTPAVDVQEMTPQWKEYFNILRRDGIVFIPEYFEGSAANLVERYKLNSEEYPPRDKYYRSSVDLNDPDVFKIVTDPRLLNVMAEYYGCQPFLRLFPGLNCTHSGSVKELEAPGFNDFWHYDTVNQLTVHILLKDISVSDNCMLFAKGSHLKHREYLTNNDYFYSEEYMDKYFEIIPCVGKAGTLVIFDSNGLHRLDLKPGTFRSHLHLNYTPGNDMKDFKDDFFKDVLKTDFPMHGALEFSRLSSLQRESVKNLVEIKD